MENWIRKALEDACEQSDEMLEAEEVCSEFLEKHMHEMLDAFCAVLPEKAVGRLARILTHDKEVSLAVRDLCGSFFLTGYVNGMHHYGQE